MEQPDPYLQFSAVHSKMGLLSWKEYTPNANEDNLTVHHNYCNSTEGM